MKFLACGTIFLLLFAAFFADSREKLIAICSEMEALKKFAESLSYNKKLDAFLRTEFDALAVNSLVK